MLKQVSIDGSINILEEMGAGRLLAEMSEEEDLGCWQLQEERADLRGVTSVLSYFPSEMGRVAGAMVERRESGWPWAGLWMC